ncbi:hypothetical protein MMC30_008572 [Trapelia coarctata]|nr:hypothetical protein [Trapelia coarctata]
MSLNAHERQQQYNDQHAKTDVATTAQQYSGIMVQIWGLEERVEEPDITRFIELANIKKRESVLDLGCGLGWLTMAARAKTIDGKIVGIDCSENMLRAFHDRLKADDIQHRFELVQDNILYLSTMERFLPSDTFPGFNVIFCRRVLGNLPFNQQESALKSWAEYLAPQGRMVVEQCHEFRYIGGVTTVNSDGVPGWKKRIAPLPVWKDTKDYFKRQVTNAGLQLGLMEKFYYDFPDHSAEITVKAREAWQASGRAGDMNRQFVENERRVWFGQMKEEEKLNNIRLSPAFASVVGVVRKAEASGET